MSKSWLVLGDRTTGGGSVITGSPHTDINGSKVARLYDKATCPRHQGIFPIISGCDLTTIIDGQPVALDGAKLSCGCSVLAGTQNIVFVEHHPPAHTHISNPVFPTIQPKADPGACSDIRDTQFNEGFILHSEFSGQPLSNRNYRIIHRDGSIEFGTTDTDGRTHIVATADIEILCVELEEESPE